MYLTSKRLELLALSWPPEQELLPLPLGGFLRRMAPFLAGLPDSKLWSFLYTRERHHLVPAIKGQRVMKYSDNRELFEEVLADVLWLYQHGDKPGGIPRHARKIQIYLNDLKKTRGEIYQGGTPASKISARARGSDRTSPSDPKATPKYSKPPDYDLVQGMTKLVFFKHRVPQFAKAPLFSIRHWVHRRRSYGLLQKPTVGTKTLYRTAPEEFEEEAAQIARIFAAGDCIGVTSVSRPVSVEEIRKRLESPKYTDPVAQDRTAETPEAESSPKTAKKESRRPSCESDDAVERFTDSLELFLKKCLRGHGDMSGLQAVMEGFAGLQRIPTTKIIPCTSIECTSTALPGTAYCGECRDIIASLRVDGNTFE